MHALVAFILWKPICQCVGLLNAHSDILCTYTNTPQAPFTPEVNTDCHRLNVPSSSPALRLLMPKCGQCTTLTLLAQVRGIKPNNQINIYWQRWCDYIPVVTFCFSRPKDDPGQQQHNDHGEPSWSHCTLNMPVLTCTHRHTGLQLGMSSDPQARYRKMFLF